MNDRSIRNPAYLLLTDQQLAEIDDLCDRFDQELVNGDAPRIESFLADAPKAARDGLLAELLVMEIEYLIQQGDVPQLNTYRQRFRQQETVVADVFARDATTQVPGSNFTATPADIPPVLHNFRLLEELGRGGMGVVWLAEQDQPVKRRVALKLIKAELTSRDVIARFDAEKQALAMMDHPNIARVLDAGTTDGGRPYFVMELVDGIPLTQYCDDHMLSVDERLKLFVSVCKAVQHAHQKGIIHRDLKPSNVLVTVIDGEAVPKVIDFGLAKAVEQNLLLTDGTMQTEFGKVVGTVQYMSPEQAELKGVDAEDIDTRTDVYSLGVMLYELLTGSTPVDQETLGRNALLRVLEIIRQEDPPRPSNRLSSSSNEVNAAVSDLRRLHPARLRQLLRGELDWVVMKALEKDRTRRYQTANDLGQDLFNYLTGDAVSARPPSTWYQLRKFARRHRGIVAALLVIGVVLLAGIAGTGYGLVQANVKKKLAEDKTKEAEQERGKAVEAEDRATVESQHARDAEADANFQLANARWETNRAGDARNLLHRIPGEYRDNFEWNFCNRRFQGSDITCYGHLDHANCVVFSPDGTQIASASTDRTIKIWDAQTGEDLATLVGHTAAVVSVAFSPDGLKLASGSDDSTIKLWDTRSGRALRTLDEHTKSVRSVAFSPDGTLLASGSDDHLIRLWDLQSDWKGLLTGHRGELLRVAFSPDSGRLVSSARDNKIKLWDVSDLQSVVEIYTLDPGGLALGISFSPDGTWIAAGGGDRITVWDADSGREINKFVAHATWIYSVPFSPDGTRLASCGDDKVIRLWDARSGQEIATLTGHSQRCMCVAFSPDGSRLASASHDTTVKLWDVRSCQQALSLRGHTREISGMAFDPHGQRLASAGFDNTIRLWDPATGLEVMKLKGHRYSVRSIVFNPDGTRLASGSADQTIRLWDSQSGQEKSTLNGHSGEVLSVAFSADGTRVASASTDRSIKLWDADSGQHQKTLSGHTSGVNSVAFSPDGKRIASGSNDRTIRLWDTDSGTEILTLRSHGHIVTCVAFSPDGLSLASASGDHSIKLWDAHSGREKFSLDGHITVVSTLAFSPNGRRLASTSSDQTLKLWNTQTGQEVATIEKSSDDLRCIAFTPDGQQIAVACDDGNIRLWPARTDHEVTTLTGHTHTVRRVTFSIDGRWIYSESANEQLVWEVATGRQMEHAKWELPAEQRHASPNGRWFVTSEFNRVLLVDREYRNRPHEKAYRAAKARFDPVWHQERATAATTAKNWYAATFHLALLVKNDPEQASFYDGLQTSFQKLKSQFEQAERDLEPHLAMAVRESLGLPPPQESLKLRYRKEWTNPSFEEPKIQTASVGFGKTIPGWTTTGKLPEIRSTGFEEVSAHDGMQFVELNADEEGMLFHDSKNITQHAVIEFSFAHRGRNGEGTLKLTITDLGADNLAGGGDDTDLFTKDYTTGNTAWTVYDSTIERQILALGNTVRIAYIAVDATGGKAPDDTEGNFLDSAEFGVGVVTAKRNAYGAKRLQAFMTGGDDSESYYLGVRNNNVGITEGANPQSESIFVLKVEPEENFAVLANRQGKYVTARAEAIVLTETREPGSRWLIRNPLRTNLDPNDGWFSLESASDPGRFLRHYSFLTYAHKRAELTAGQAALFPADASWKFEAAE